MLLQMVDVAPDLFFQSSVFPLAFRASMAALTLVHSDVVFAALDLFRSILTHDCLSPTYSRPPPPKFPIYASIIQAVIEKEGFELVGYLLAGLVGDFPEDSASTVVSIFRVFSALWSSQLVSWLPPIVQQLPTSSVPNQTKNEFLTDVTKFVILATLTPDCEPKS
jgi:transportin-3